ncbi:outer membrane efflux family protein, partial [Vibrio parahaemolyticus IDH02640]
AHRCWIPKWTRT